MSRLVHRLRGNADAPRSPNFFDLSDLHPIGNMRGGLITNKAGRAVLRARHRGRDVKLYEAHSPQHARFIAAVSAALPDLFPEVLELRGAWVMAEWIEGRPPEGAIQERQAEALRRIHALPPEDLPPAGFCYLRDFLLPRYLRAAALAGEASTLDAIAAQTESAGDARIVMHPDLSPDNLLRAADGRLVCIDNELLCTGRLPLLDLCNAMRPLGQDQRNRLAATWFEGAPPAQDQIERTAKAWMMREAGSAFITGRMSNCAKMISASKGELVAKLPFAGTIDRTGP